MTARAFPLQRLFLALWPTDEVRERLLQWRASAQWVPGAAVVPAERLHLTLHFIGTVPAEQVPAVQAALQAPAASCELRFEAPQLWPGGIAVLPLASVPPDLATLHGALAHALRAQGLPPEQRTWRPHVTLARKAQGAVLPSAPAWPWPVDNGYVLVRSMPAGGYAVLHRYA